MLSHIVEAIIKTIHNLVVSYGAWGVFYGSLIEEIVSFIPSSAVMVFSGFFIMENTPLSPAAFGTLALKIALPVAFGLTIGSFVVYGLVYFLGEPFIRNYGKYIGVSWGEIEKLHDKLNGGRADEIVFFIVRSIPIIPFVIINAFCGLVRWPILTYTIITFAGAYIRGMIVGFLGWQLGRAYFKHNNIFDNLEHYIMYSLIFLILAFIVYRKLRRKSEVVE